ncbi:hypothetical protein PENTCL1PPCAC_14587, partial [Pristionchus entomophagus]
REKAGRQITVAPSMDFLYLFGLWVSALQISVLALPLSLVQQWRKRGSSAGYSDVQLIVPIPIHICWMRYGWLTSDMLMVTTNFVLLASTIAYFVIFVYYLPDKTSIAKPVSIALTGLLAVMIYVSLQSASEQASTMGKLAPLVQNTRIMGAIHLLKTIVDKKTTEYLPYQTPFFLFFYLTQNVIYAFMTGKYPVFVASLPGLFFNTTYLIMYVVYPPKTWRVPILGTGNDEAMEEKK